MPRLWRSVLSCKEGPDGKGGGGGVGLGWAGLGGGWGDCVAMGGADRTAVAAAGAARHTQERSLHWGHLSSSVSEELQDVGVVLDGTVEASIVCIHHRGHQHVHCSTLASQLQRGEKGGGMWR